MKIMSKVSAALVMVLLLGNITAQDVAGNYVLSGVNVRYFNIARPNFVDTDVFQLTAEGHHVAASDGAGGSLLTVTEPLTGAVIAIREIPPGAVIGEFLQDHFGLAVLQSVGVNLNVNFYEDGTGEIAEGSQYPDANLGIGSCETILQVLPIVDQLIYASDLTAADNGLVGPYTNVLGLPGIYSYAGQPVGALALSQSVVFSYYSLGGDQVAVDYPVYLPPSDALLAECGANLADGELPTNSDALACISATGALGGDPSGPALDCIMAGGNPAECVAGAVEGCVTACVMRPLSMGGVMLAAPVAYGGTGYFPGLGSGHAVKGDLITHGSYADGHPGNAYQPNPAPDFVIHWQAIDGEAAETGMGDILYPEEGWDEDGDGSIIDRIYGLANLTATFMNPACGYNYPILGDQASISEGLWGGVYMVEFGECMAAVGDEATCSAVAAGAADEYVGTCVDTEGEGTDFYLMDASFANWGGFFTMNAAQFSGCLAQGNDEATCGALFGGNDGDHDFNGTDGRLTVHFDPTCIPVLETLEVEVEFQEISDCVAGDVNGDMSINVIDVVQTVGHILGTTTVPYPDCADVTGDGEINILDVVAIVAIILGGRTDEATSVELIKTDDGVTFSADGHVGAFQMTIAHDENFTLELTEDAFVKDYNTEGTKTTLIVVAPESNELFTTTGHFTIENVVAANSNGYIDVSINNPAAFSISNAYPNPFNPTTNLTLNMNENGNVSVKVYNVIGQVVDVLVDEYMDAGTYSLMWDATDAPSGLYLIESTVGSKVENQKVMLLK